MTFSHASRGRLTHYDIGRFPSQSLFDRIARAVCDAGCLPRKELYEAWETARRVRRLLRGSRVIDVAGGHGLLAHVMLLLDDSSSSAIVCDPEVPASASQVHEALVQAWPRLAGRVIFDERPLEHASIAPGDVMISSHACGALTDRILDRAIEARVPVAVLPCCHDLNTCNPAPLAGWMAPDLAIDALRAVRLERAGYRVWTQTIPADITPKNRLLIGIPHETSLES